MCACVSVFKRFLHSNRLKEYHTHITHTNNTDTHTEITHTELKKSSFLDFFNSEIHTLVLYLTYDSHLHRILYIPREWVPNRKKENLHMIIKTVHMEKTKAIQTHHKPTIGS